MSQSLEANLESSRVIRQALQRISARARERHPFLAHQDALGFAILLVSAAAIVGCALGYAYDLLPAWLVVLGAYLRQLVAREVMRAHGVRFNDFASMGRANRWHAPREAATVLTPALVEA